MAGQTSISTANNQPSVVERSEPAADLVRDALIETLLHDGALIAALEGNEAIFDEAPEPLVWPHITIGDVSIDDDNRVVFAVHGHSKDGYVAADSLAGAVMKSLCDVPIEVDGRILSGIRSDTANIVREPGHLRIDVKFIGSLEVA